MKTPSKKQQHSKRRGQGMTEYIIIVALIAILRDLLKDDSGPRFDVKRFKKPVGGENTGSTSCDFNVNNDKQNIPRCTFGKIIHELAHIAKSKSSGSATPDAYSFSGEGYEAEGACFGSLDGSRPPSADNSCAISGQ